MSCGGFTNTDFNGLTFTQVKEGRSRARARIDDLWPDLSDPVDTLRFLSRMIHTTGRLTVARNIRLDPSRPRWARVPRGGKSCAFCLMLASRDFTYTSAEAAGYDFERLYQERYKPFWEPGDSVRDTIRRRDKIIKVRASTLLEVPGAKDWNTCSIDPCELAYRQASLLSDTSGEKLYSHEFFS